MNYAHTPALTQSQQPKDNSDNGEIPAQLHCLNVALDYAEQQLELLADHMESVLRPPQPQGQSEASGDLDVPIATPLGANIQSARYQVERISTRMIDIRTRIGL